MRSFSLKLVNRIRRVTANSLYELLTSISEKYAERMVRICHWEKHDLLMTSCVHVFEPSSNKFDADEKIMIGLLICGDMSVEWRVQG